MNTNTTTFEVESAFEADGRAYVIARLLDLSSRFEINDTATLAGCPVEQWLEVPRAVGPDGKQRTDLFGFCLRSRKDLSVFKTGIRVLLALS